jgi:hypothetical protein
MYYFARVIVTKWMGSLGETWRWRRGVIWDSPCFIEMDSIGILHFQPKIFGSKLIDFKSFKSNGLAIYVSKIKPSKIFRSKLPKARINEGIRPPIFGHLFVHQKCPFCPLCVEVLKHEMQNTQKMGL